MSNEQQIRRIASREVQKIARELSGVSSVVIATVDGFDIASVGLNGDDPGRIAAMASSVSAIGSVISQEESLGRSPGPPHSDGIRPSPFFQTNP